MDNRLKEIKSTAQLITYIRCHGTPTDLESICTMQDIVGHEAIETLENIAQTHSGTFYTLLYKIWNWQDATEFYNRVSNQVYISTMAKAKENAAEVKRLKEKTTAQAEQIYKTESDLTTTADRVNELTTELKEAKEKAEAYEQEIIRLKAKLYDLYENR